MDDMIGKVFGELEVVCKLDSAQKYTYKYVCKCIKCGHEIIKDKKILKDWKNYCPKCKSPIGKIFGDFKVLSRVDVGEKYKYTYECECINCGHKENKTQSYLKHTKSKCSNCNETYNVRDLTDSHNELVGKTFGKLTVISFHKLESGGHRVWECECECGNKCYKNTAYFNRENDNSMCPDCKNLLRYTKQQRQIAENISFFDEHSVKEFLNTNEEFRSIKNFDGYFIGCFGTVVSCKYKFPKILSAWLDGKKRYYMVSLCNETGEHKKLVHRLVADAFVCNSNPELYDTVNHKDCNEKNNDFRNLEWCTDEYNTHYSYQTLPPDRNRMSCILIFPNGEEKKFESYADVVRYKRENNLNFSETGLQKYCKSKSFKLIKLGKTSNENRTGWTKKQIDEIISNEEIAI